MILALPTATDAKLFSKVKTVGCPLSSSAATADKFWPVFKVTLESTSGELLHGTNGFAGLILRSYWPAGSVRGPTTAPKAIPLSVQTSSFNRTSTGRVGSRLAD